MASPDSSVVLVTGASRGIGRAAAQALAARGFRVAVHYHRNTAAAEAVLGQLPGSGHRLFRADTGDPESCRSLVAEVLAHCGRLDVLVNNAGIYEEHDVHTVDTGAWRAAWQRTIATNLLGPAELIHAAVKHMLPRRQGRLISVTSRGAFRGEPTAPAYGAAKAGLNALTQSMARALAPDGIGCYVVAPGWVDTDMGPASFPPPQRAEILAQHPLGRVATPEEIGATIAWLATDAPLALTGAMLDANGASYLRS